MAAVDTDDDAADDVDADAADNADDADDADASTSSSNDSAATDGGHRAASKWRRWCACDAGDGSMRCSAEMQSATPSGGMAMFCEHVKSNKRRVGIEKETFTR